MKLTIEKTQLENILSNCQNFLEKRDISQITAHVFFQCRENTLIIKATDYEIAIQSEIEVQSEEEGKATANGRDILNFIKTLKEGNITLEVENNTLLIKQNRSKLNLPMYNVDEFPDIPEYTPDHKLNIESNKFLNSIKKINSAIDTNNPKFELNGALLDIKEYSFNFVATDTRRLAIIKHESQGINTLSLIISKRSINEILKLFVDEIEIFYNQTHIIIKSGQYTFFGKIISSKYPNYESIIPKEFKYTLQLPKDKFIESVKIVSSLSNKIKINFQPNEILFESLSDKNHKASTQIELDIKIQDFVLGVDSKYLLDFLSQIDSDEFTLQLDEQNNKPIMLSDHNFITIIMPIIL